MTDINEQRARLRDSEAERERDEAKAFVLEFRGVVTSEMVWRAYGVLKETGYQGSTDNIRAALQAANICESCASVADHLSNQLQSASSRASRLEEEVGRLREALAYAREQLVAVRDWTTEKCPCKNETPDPCPLCGTTVKEGVCKAGSRMPHLLAGRVSQAIVSARAALSTQGGLDEPVK